MTMRVWVVGACVCTRLSAYSYIGADEHNYLIESHHESQVKLDTPVINFKVSLERINRTDGHV